MASSTSTSAPHEPVPLRRDAQRNLERILDAARDAFVEEGIEVGVDAIARRAGVGVGTLYRRFPTKEALIDAIMDRRADELTALADRAEAAPDPWDGFVLFLGEIMERQAHDRGFKALMAAHTITTGRPALRDQLRPQMVRLVTRAQQAGALRADVTIDDITVLLWGAGRAFEITGEILPDYWRRYLAMVLDALRAPHATPLPGAPPTLAQSDELSLAWASSCRAGR